MVAAITGWDDYFFPGTSVLRNRFNETDAARLRAKEEFAAQARLIELATSPVEGDFDYAHMKEIHRRIFHDVYDWAGQERVGPAGWMSKQAPNVVDYPPGDPAAPLVDYLYYPGVASQRRPRSSTDSWPRRTTWSVSKREPFVARFAEHWGELNTIHSFREGNTRAQFVFFTQLAEHAGYRLDSERFQIGEPLRDAFVAARFHNQATTQTDRLINALSQAIDGPLILRRTVTAGHGVDSSRERREPSSLVDDEPVEDRQPQQRRRGPGLGR